MGYQWVPDSRYSVKAEVVGREIEALVADEGVCHPRRLWERARDENAPHHALFEWDDAVAAAIHRDEQARRIIRSIRVITEVEADGDGEPVAKEPRIAFVHVTCVTDDEVAKHGYVPFREAMTTSSYRSQVLREALGQLNGLRRRYNEITALQPVWSALDDIMERQDLLAEDEDGEVRKSADD